MKKYLATLVFLTCALMIASSLWASDQGQTSKVEDYIIGPGDVLEISVWNNEALTKQATVLPDGKIHFPLIGEVVVGGKTIAGLEKELKERIGAFVPDPNLYVMVQGTNSMVVYIIGEVNSPGRFGLNANINVLQALAMAGGFNQWAKKNKIKILRETNGQTLFLDFAYDDLIEGKNLGQNIRLQRGDIVLIP